jgi:hypothetical protein
MSYQPRVVGTTQFGTQPLVEYEFNGRMLVNRNLMIYGGSLAGKSELTKYLISLIQDDELIPIYHLFTTTPKNFEGQIPNAYIHLTYDPVKLREIYDRNVAQTTLYNETNKLVHLRSLYKLRPDRLVAKLLQELETSKRALLASYAPAGSVELRSMEEEANEKCNEIERTVLKRYVQFNLAFYRKQRLDKQLLLTLQYIDFNPHTAIIFDDVAALIQGATKKDRKVLMEIYFQGRNQNITTIMTAQQDTSMDKSFRDNAHISIYTDKITTGTCFSTGRQMPKSITESVGKILKSDSNFFNRDTKIYRMLVYLRMLGDKLGFIISRRVPTIQYGSEAYWQLAADIEKTNMEKESNNPYLKRFMAKADADERSRFRDQDIPDTKVKKSPKFLEFQT